MNMYFKNVRCNGTSTVLLNKVALDEKGVFITPNRLMVTYRKKELKNINPYIPEQELDNKVLAIDNMLTTKSLRNVRLYIDEGCDPIELLRLIKLCDDMNYEIVHMTISDYKSSPIESPDGIDNKQETNTYTLDGFLKGEFSINCETYEDNCTLLKTLHDRGTRWNTNRIVSTSETCWRRYREDTMYTIGHDSDGKLTFGHMINKGDRIVVPFKSVDLQGV